MDWTDLESFSRPPPRGTSDCADPEASWGHRKNNLLRSEDELFYGYYLSAAIMMPDEDGPAVPELARRATVSSCRNDPVRAFAPVLTAMPAAGIPLGDILDDSGYAHRDAGRLGAPAARRRRAARPGPAPARPRPQGHPPRRDHQQRQPLLPPAPAPLLELGPLARTATQEQAADHDRKTAELARYKLGRLTADDADGYHRVQCPAAMGKIRCPLRPGVDDPGPGPARDPPAPRASPGLLRPADHHRPARTCSPRPRRSTTTRPRPGAAPTPAAPAPSAASPPSRTPPASDIARGWCRLMGLAPLMLFTATLLVVRNQRILAAWNARQEENQRRAAAGLPPKTRRRRRKTLAGLAAGPP